MSDLTLIIGNKNLSSWSLRPWLLAKHFGIAFSEEFIRLDTPVTYSEVKKHSPSGLVPFLKDGDLGIGDSLAIIEYLADRHPEHRIWPEDMRARALARSMAAEMHSGFANLRGTWPMDMINEHKALSCPPGVAKDLRRIHTLWTSALEASGGPFLFGAFTGADAMFAPVVSRIRTYGPVSSFAPLEDYMTTVWELPAMEEWRAGAREEEAQGWYR